MSSTVEYIFTQRTFRGNHKGVGLALNLLEEVGDGLVVEGQATAQQGIEYDPAAPHINLRTGVELPRDDLHYYNLTACPGKASGLQPPKCCDTSIDARQKEAGMVLVWNLGKL
jgi:hypothetical protein